ncbi:MAG: CheR family methyltransferase [Desulfovermiculus sp.]
MNEQTIDTSTFQNFVQLIYERAGIRLGPNKQALVASRLGKRMRRVGISCYKAYFEYVRQDRSESELVALLDEISTNVTQFYREPRHFQVLARIMAEWEAQGQKRFRLWCAAASTGEEPYTMAITLAETLSSVADTKILATDLSTRVLEHARQGVYDAKRMEKVPKELINRYFSCSGHGPDKMFAVSSRLKNMLTFARLNLSEIPFPMRGPLDVIFCRNVMIYFDNHIRKQLLDEMYRLLKPKGYLMVGHAESLSGLLSNFKSVEPSVYIRP